jgi:hypothetical protein
MTAIIVTHERAMRLADKALEAKRGGFDTRAKSISKDAAREEEMAAAMSPFGLSRSVLFRSAAWLALDAGESAWANALAVSGLVHCPAAEIRDELLEVQKAAQEAMV